MDIKQREFHYEINLIFLFSKQINLLKYKIKKNSQIL
jgi:hypothetical protein